MDSPLDEPSWENCLTFTESVKNQIVIFIYNIMTDMVNNTHNEIEYIRIIPLHMVWKLGIMVKQDDEDCQLLLMDILDSSRNEISVDEFVNMQLTNQQMQGRKQMKEQVGLLEDQCSSDPGILLITNNASLRTFNN